MKLKVQEQEETQNKIPALENLVNVALISISILMGSSIMLLTFVLLFSPEAEVVQFLSGSIVTFLAFYTIFFLATCFKAFLEKTTLINILKLVLCGILTALSFIYVNHKYSQVEESQQQVQQEEERILHYEIIDAAGGGRLKETSSSADYLLIKNGTTYAVDVIKNTEKEKLFTFTELNTLPE